MTDNNYKTKKGGIISYIKSRAASECVLRTRIRPEVLYATLLYIGRFGYNINDFVCEIYL
jgi:hypothetical protein